MPVGENHRNDDPPVRPGFNTGITAVADSGDARLLRPLKTSIPGIDVHAEVNRQWSAGESILQTLKAEELEGDVIVGLGTNDRY